MEVEALKRLKPLKSSIRLTELTGAEREGNTLGFIFLQSPVMTEHFRGS